MLDDKQKIRELIDTWMRASAAGDVSQLLGLMDEDVVFLLKCVLTRDANLLAEAADNP